MFRVALPIALAPEVDVLGTARRTAEVIVAQWAEAARPVTGPLESGLESALATPERALLFAILLVLVLILLTLWRASPRVGISNSR